MQTLFLVKSESHIRKIFIKSDLSLWYIRVMLSESTKASFYHSVMFDEKLISFINDSLPSIARYNFIFIGLLVIVLLLYPL